MTDRRAQPPDEPHPQVEPWIDDHAPIEVDTGSPQDVGDPEDDVVVDADPGAEPGGR